jgi:hypothetical protein
MQKHASSANREFNMKYDTTVLGLRNKNRQLFPLSVTAKAIIFIIKNVWSMEIQKTVNTVIFKIK